MVYSSSNPHHHHKNVGVGKLSEVKGKLTFSSIVTSITVAVINKANYRFFLAK
jgi:hypothetical protein